MRVCVVGNGPSAAGRGTEIDACDFVVRIKDFSVFGAEDAGGKLNAWVWYGTPVRWLPCAPEHWITQSIREFERRERTKQDGFVRLKRIAQAGAGSWLRFIQDEMVLDLKKYLSASASTGLRAIAMALTLLPEELVITGFDAMDDETDARGDQHRPPCHNLRNEKRLLCELENGLWLGTPCKTRLTWLGRPEQLVRNV